VWACHEKYFARTRADFFYYFTKNERNVKECFFFCFGAPIKEPLGSTKRRGCLKKWRHAPHNKLGNSYGNRKTIVEFFYTCALFLMCSCVRVCVCVRVSI